MIDEADTCLAFFFSFTGTIYTAVPDLDREKTPVYTIVVEAVDGHGLHSEESGTATVRISLTDINDNFPTFRKS